MRSVAVVIFGCLGRSLHITHKNHEEKIFNNLPKPHEIFYINNQVKIIDGQELSNEFKKLISPTLITEVTQEHIDSEITRLHPNYRSYFRPNYIKKAGINPLRNSYIETMASELLNSIHLRKHSHAVVFCSDFWFEKEFSESWLRGGKVVVSNQNPAEGYTNGLYIGEKKMVGDLLNSFSFLGSLAQRDYEKIIELNARKNKIPVIEKSIKFLKIRANGEPAYKHSNKIWEKICHIEREYESIHSKNLLNFHQSDMRDKKIIRFAHWKTTSPKEHARQHKLLTPSNTGIWGRAEISDDSSQADISIIHEYTSEKKLKKQNSLVLGYEPSWIYNLKKRSHKRRLHFNEGTCWQPQNWQFFIDLSYDDLKQQPTLKSKNLSIILSNKEKYIGHKLRHSIVSKISSLDSASIDIWGSVPPEKYKNCKGSPDGPLGNEGQTKGIKPYRYYLSIENGQADYYFSEKITVPYLFLTMPFYWGCKKIDKFFPKESYIQINPDKKGEAERIIELSKSPIREENIEYLKEAKDLVMNKYNAMATIDMALRSNNLIRDFC